MGDNGACASGKSAQELLVEFQQTGRQEPFAEIARRYAGMVYNVALNVTRNTHDAEDATQATFLTLAVHAKTANKIRFVGPWLRKVSHRLALDIRRSKKRRRAREERHANGNGNGTGNGHIDEAPISANMHLEELRNILREELDKLPGKYRMPLILYYFGGLSPEEMGKELGLNTSTLGVRLHRGRKMLAQSLSSRGIAIDMALLGGLLAGLVDSVVRDNLVHSASRAAVQAAAGGAICDGAMVSTSIISLVHSATAAIRLNRLKVIVTATVLLITTLTGAGEAIRHYDLLDAPVLRNFNLLRFIRPLLQRLLSGPQYAIDQNSAFDLMAPIVVQNQSAGNMPVSFVPPIDSSPARGWVQIDPWFDTLRAKAESPQSVTASRISQPAAPIDGGGFSAPAPHFNADLNVLTQLPHRGFQPQDGAEASNSIQPLLLAPVAAVAGAKSIAMPPASIVESSSSPAAQQPSAALLPQVFDSLVIDNTIGSAMQSGQLPAGGGIRANRMVVGDSSAGMYSQSSGLVQINTALVLGSNSGSSGTYHVSGTAALTAPAVVVGESGRGVLAQSGGQVSITTDRHAGLLTLAANEGGSGTYKLDGGTLVADNIIVGAAGEGQIQQSGGTASLSHAMLGEQIGAQGTWAIDGGLIQLATAAGADAAAYIDSDRQSPAAPPTPSIVVGGEGAGAFVLGSAGGTGAIREQPGTSGSTLLIRSSADSSGMLHGWGVVRLSGPLVQNGRVVADGFGLPRALDLSGASLVTNTIENPSTGGTGGWYATDGGTLILPPIKISGSGLYTWGEDSKDPVLDLINSVRLNPYCARGTDATNGLVTISLVDPATNQVPPLPDGRQPLSLWQLSSTLDLSSIDLMVRYDDQAALAAQIPESELAIWTLRNGTWMALSDASRGIDLHNHLVWGTATGAPAYFATSLIPEPATLALAVSGAAAIILRRRQRHK